MNQNEGKNAVEAARTGQIERIAAMEKRMRRAVDALSALIAALDAYDEARADFRELEAYYDGADWRQDFEDDEAGRLPSPADLPRGVLSEDGIYDLLGLERDVLGRMAETAGERMEETI